MTADPEWLGRLEARLVKCPRCGSDVGQDCDMVHYVPPTSRAAKTYHGARLLRHRQGW